MRLHVSNENVVFSAVMEYLSLDYRAEFNDNVLHVEISEDKLLKVLSSLAKEYADIYRGHTGVDQKVREIDVIKVKIGSYEFEAKEEFESSINLKSHGFRKVK